MTETFIILGKLIASSALLYAFYWIVLRNKASYTMSRLYLLLIPFISIMMSGLSIPIYQSQTVTIDAPATIASTENPSITPSAQPLIQESSQQTVTPIQEEPSLLSSFDVNDYSQWCVILWAGIALVLIITALYHIAALYVMSRKMIAQTTPEGFSLIRSTNVPAPCSFAKTIFMPTSITGNSENLILRHEKAHIRHAHFIDVWVMELITRLLWFNPFMWMTRNELRNVHEFEADHDVMTSGADMSVYQTLLLEQVMDNGSLYANGFNHSFIRRRFIEMKHSTAGTLGKLGKLCMGAWVTLLFCGFTFAETNASDVKPAVPELQEPQMFVIEGTAEGACAKSDINIYLSDEYMHFKDDKPAMTVPVKDGKFHAEIPLKKMVAGRVQSTCKDAKAAELFFVPKETVVLHMAEHYSGILDYNSFDFYSYSKKVERGIFILRNVTNWESPYLPKIKGKKWDNVTSENMSFPEMSVKEVFFNKDETVLRIYAYDYYTGLCINKDFYLTDEKGNQYKLRRALYGKINENNGPEIRAFGGYYAFDPVPKDVKELNLMYAYYDTESKTIRVLGPGISHIKKAPKEVVRKPNFKVDITVSQGINDSGYLVAMYNKDMTSLTQIADLTVVNRKASFETYVEEPRMVDLTATFPDGSICTHCVRFPFVPGEHAEVKVMNGTFYLTGSTFYKQYSDADELEENARKYHKEEETQKLLVNYLKEHANEEGCVIFYYKNNILPRETILQMIPESVKNGRFKDIFNALQ